MKKNLLLCGTINIHMQEFKKGLVEDVTILLEIVEEVTGVSAEQIRGRNRKRHISDARKMATEALRRNSKYRLWEIGKSICGLDHSTVVHNKMKVAEFCENEYDFREKFVVINSRFKQIKDGGMPLAKRLEYAIKERDQLNKEIRRMKKLLKL